MESARKTLGQHCKTTSFPWKDGRSGDPDRRNHRKHRIFPVKKRALVAMCADNGVVEEGVTQTGQEVTAIVAENFLRGDTSACVMCRQCGTDVFPVDVGMVVDTKVPYRSESGYGNQKHDKRTGNDKRRS